MLNASEGIQTDLTSTLLETARILDRDTVFEGNYGVLLKEARSLNDKLDDPKLLNPPPVNPFLTEGRCPKSTVDELVYTLGQHFLLDKQAKVPGSIQELLDSTFHPMYGVFARLESFMKDNPNYNRAMRAFQLIEAEYRQLFIREEISSKSLAVNSGEQSLELPSKVLTVRQNMLFKLLVILGIIFVNREDIIKYIRSLVERIERGLPLLASRETLTALSPTSSADYRLLPTEDAELVYSFLTSATHSRDAKVRLHELHAKLQKLKPLLEAFRRVLAQDILEDRGKNPNSLEAKQLTLLLTPAGSLKTMANAGTRDNDPTKSLFGVLPGIIHGNCAELKLRKNFNPDSEREVAKPRSMSFPEEKVNVGRFPEKIPEGSDYPFMQIYLGRTLNNFYINVQGMPRAKYSSKDRTSGIPFIESWVQQRGLSFFVEKGDVIKKCILATSFWADSNYGPQVEWEEQGVVYDKPYDKWFVTGSNLYTIVIELNGRYYQVMDNFANIDMIF